MTFYCGECDCKLTPIYVWSSTDPIGFMCPKCKIKIRVGN